MKVFSVLLCLLLLTPCFSQVTFDVADVTPAEEPMFDTSARVILEDRITHQLIFKLPQELKEARLVPYNSNGFISTMYHAYNEHRPLALSPDDFWLLICQGISIHVNKHYDSLAPFIVKKDHPKEIRIRNDELDTSDRAWADLTNEISLQAQQYLKEDIYSYMTPSFSTTTPLITTAYQVTLLETFKQTFNFSGASGCGIPSITLRGTKEDWIALQNRLSKLSVFGLTYWADELHPLFNEFIATFDGNINRPFWDKMYKEHRFYGTEQITGWILKFFPYVKTNHFVETDDGDFYVEELLIPNKYLKGEDHHFSRLTSGQLPKGMANIDIVWDQYFPSGKFKSDSIQFYAGFVGPTQDETTLCLSPMISWYALKNNDSESHHDYRVPRSKHVDSLWTNRLWITEIEDSCSHPPIFLPEKFDNYTDGLKGFRKVVERKVTIPKHTEIQFLVTWSGSIAQVNVYNKELSKKEIEKIATVIEDISIGWKPAEKDAKNNLRRMRIDSFSGRIKVNYRVRMNW